MDDQAPSGGNKPPPGTAAPGESSGSADQRIQAIIQAAEQAAAGIIEDADAQARHYIDSSRQKADALADERVRVMSGLTETLVRQAELVRRQSDELLSALDSARDELAGHLGKELTPGAAAPAALAPQSSIVTEARPEPEPVSEAAPEKPAEPEQTGSTPPPGGSRVPHLQSVESKPPGLRSVETTPEPEPEIEEVKPRAAPEPPPVKPASTPPPGSAPPASAPSQPSAPAPPEPSPSAAPGGLPTDGARLLAAQMAVAGSSREEIEARLRKEFDIEDAGPILDGILGPS
jgi:hypothetical protein